MPESRELTVSQNDLTYLRSLPERIDSISDRVDLVGDKLSEHDNLFDKISIIAAASEPEAPSYDKLFAALAKAQGEISNAELDGKADAGSYTYQYATLDSVLNAIRGPLSKNGLVLLQLPSYETTDKGTLIRLETILGHSSGQSITDYFAMYPPKSDPQGIGSCLTYMRRYTAMAIVGVAGAADDDAEKTKAEKETISAAQADQIFNLADELFGADSEAMLERMCKKIHMVDAVRDIPADEYDIAMQRMRNQAEKRGTKAPEEVEGKGDDKPAVKKPAKPSA